MLRSARTMGGGALQTGALLAWLAAISHGASVAAAETWSVPWIGAYLLAVVSALVMGRSGRRPRHRVLGYGGALIIVFGAAVSTLFPAPHPPTAGVLTAVDVPLVLGLGLGIANAILHAVDAPVSRWRDALPLVIGVGLLIVWVTTMLMEYVARPNLWHGSEFYIVAGSVLPLILAFAAAVSSRGWSATGAAGVYMILILIAMWVFQTIPVSANGGQSPRGYLLPPAFPLILVLPALSADMLLARLPRDASIRQRTATFALVGVTFVVLMAAVHWPLAEFLLSPKARNAVFAADRWPFYADLGEWRYQYWTLDFGTRRLAAGMALATILATCSAGAGHWLGQSISRADNS